MTWSHSEKTHSNWAETIRKALQEGKVTTEITFDGTRYRIVLMPYDPATSAPVFDKNRTRQRSTCKVCGKLVLWVVSSQQWRHTQKGKYCHDPEPTERITFPGHYDNEGTR